MRAFSALLSLRGPTRLFCACAAMAGCTPEAPPSTATPAQAPSLPGGGAALPVASGGRVATTGELGTPSEAYVTQPTFVRRIASDSKDVSVPGTKKRQANWLATLNRGEHVRVLALHEGWLRVQSSDEGSGWIKQEGVLVGPEIAQATNLGPLRRFTRPDLLALVPAKPIEPGSLLFVLRHKEAFSEVNYAGNATAWVLSDALERGDDEIEAAKVLHRARQLAERHDAAAEALYELARSRFGKTRLVATYFAPPAPPQGALPTAVQEAAAPTVPAAPFDAWTSPSAGPPDTGLPPGSGEPAPAPPIP